MNGSLPSEHITVRFEEFERYDPMSDREMVRFMAITNYGTYHAEIERFGPRSLRKNRERFQARAVECIKDGMVPCEIEMRDQ